MDYATVAVSGGAEYLGMTRAGATPVDDYAATSSTLTFTSATARR